MKFKGIFTLCLAGAAALAANAQTHQEGREYYKADQLENAKDLLTRSLSNPQTDKAVSNYYLGLIALGEKDNAAAAKYFEQGIAADADNPYNYVGQGRIQLLNGDAKAAETLFKQAEKLTKKDPGVEIAIARAYDAVDPVVYAKQITKAVDKARKYDLESPEIYLFEGDILKEKKDWGGAAAKYEMAANYDPNATAAYVKYANLFTQVNPDYAVKMLTNLLSVNPNSALGQRELANAYYNKKDYKKDAELYGQYVKNPSHFKSDEDRYSFLLFYGGDYKNGYDYATQLLAANPKNFTAQRYQFMNAAQIPEMQQQILPLAEALYAVHKANPSVNKMAPIDYTLIADELDRAKRIDEAIDVLNEAIKEMPENANFNKQLSMIYVDKGDLEAAANAYKGYIEKTEEPGYNDFVQQATFLYYAGVQTKNDPAKFNQYLAEEEEVINKAAEAYPGYYKPNKMRGDIAKLKADKANAEKAAAPLYEKAIAEYETLEAPSNAAKNDAMDMYIYLGNYYYTLGDKAKAKTSFNKAIEIDPSNEELRKFADSL